MMLFESLWGQAKGHANEKVSTRMIIMWRYYQRMIDSFPAKNKK